MRALVVERPGGPEALRARELPAPLPGPGHVVVAVEAAGVNPVDAGNRADPAWAGLRPPFVVGYELAGTVEATALPLAGATALQLLDRLAPRPGEWVLVHGAAGGVGSLFVQLARARGARVAASASARREALLERLGAEVFLDRLAGDVAGRARQAIGQDLDMVADLVGHRTLAASLPVLREGGRAGSIVELAGDLEPVIDRNITLHGVLMRPGRAVLDALAAEVGAGRLRPVVDQVLDLEDAATAHRRVETGRGQGKVVLRVGG
jgi:NADPH2:quinone reductase